MLQKLRRYVDDKRTHANDRQMYDGIKERMLFVHATLHPQSDVLFPFLNRGAAQTSSSDEARKLKLETGCVRAIRAAQLHNGSHFGPILSTSLSNTATDCNTCSWDTKIGYCTIISLPAQNGNFIPLGKLNKNSYYFENFPCFYKLNGPSAYFTPLYIFFLDLSYNI